MRVSPQSPSEEFEIIEEIAAYLNENEEVVEAAANSVIADTLDYYNKRLQRNIDAVMDNQKTQDAINQAKEKYGRVMDDYGDQEGYAQTIEAAKKVYAIVSWFEQNYADMSEPQRYVMTNKFLIPMVRNTFRSTMDIADVEEDGKPKMFDELVGRQVEMMGGQPTKMRTYSESVEEQIARIERLLADQAPLLQEVDIRLYKMQIDAVVSAERATGGTKLLQDELRSIEGVTIISVEETRDLPTGGDFTRFNVKFSLKGQAPRLDFVKESLLPALRRIKGFEIKDWSMPTEVTPGKRRISESNALQEYGFGGGLGGNLGAQRYTHGTEMPTPRPQLQSLLDDWVEGGVMAYDAPTNTTDMRYHVMMPAEELWPFCDGEYRGDMKDFKGRYQQFIKNGATAPVYLALGMNGRIKITGGQDLVWFAKKSGLEELPVFLSYQKQV